MVNVEGTKKKPQGGLSNPGTSVIRDTIIILKLQLFFLDSLLYTHLGLL